MKQGEKTAVVRGETRSATEDPEQQMLGATRNQENRSTQGFTGLLKKPSDRPQQVR